MTTKQSYEVGTIKTSNNDGDVVILRKLPKARVEVEFLRTATIKTVSYTNFKLGIMKDPSQMGGKYRVGSVHTNKYGTYEVVKVMGDQDRVIRFTDTGNIRTTNVGNLSRGSVCNV